MMNRSKLLLTISGTAFVLGLGALFLAISSNSSAPRAALAAADEMPTMVVYRSPACGCCETWTKRMEEAGFTVKLENVTDMRAVKTEFGVPPHLGACHTAVVSGYVVEGHVPADAVKRLLKDQPDIVGIAVPGMPVGSPGMEQGSPANYSNYQVLAFDSNGGTEVFGEY